MARAEPCASACLRNTALTPTRTRLCALLQQYSPWQALALGLICSSALMIWKVLMLWTGSESPVVVVLSGSMEPGFQRGDILFLRLDEEPFHTGEVVGMSSKRGSGQAKAHAHECERVCVQAVTADLCSGHRRVQVIADPCACALASLARARTLARTLVCILAVSSLALPRHAVFNIHGRDIPIVHRVVRVHEDEGTGTERILTKGDNNYGDDRVLYAHGQEWLGREHIMGRSTGYLPHVGMVTIIMNDYPLVKFLLIGVLGLLVVTGKE